MLLCVSFKIVLTKMSSTNHFNCEVVECPICMIEIDGTNNRVTTECGHAFHTKCLLSNVAFNGFGCPYCRSEMVEESVANHLHEDDDEDDDDEDDDDEDDDDDDEIDNDEDNQLNESDMLRGFRFMLERTTGEILTNQDDILEENEYEIELLREEKPKPSVALISKKLSENGITFETLIKALLIDHKEYSDYFDKDTNEEGEDYTFISDNLYDKIHDIIEEYSPDQEEDLIDDLKEEPIETLCDELLSILPSNMFENEEKDYNFYFLENEFIDKCKEDVFITSMIDFVY